MDNEILEILKRLERKIDDNTTDIKEIKTKLDGVVDQTADLTEFRTDTTVKLDKLINVTKDNCFEISNLKVVK